MNTYLSTNATANGVKNLVIPSYSPDLNLYDAPENGRSVGETWLTNTRTQYPKVAVIELSTKAVKLLVNLNPENTARYAFSFDDFHRETQKTETGMLLNFYNEMDLCGFKQRVLPIICQYAHLAKMKYCVDVIYTVATAAYRTAVNQEDVLKLIKAETGLNVYILPKKVEATTSLYAYSFSTRDRAEFLSHEYHILLDQGGGSTEISLFHHRNLIDSCSLETGTTLLKTLLYRKLSENLETRINDIAEIAALKTQKELSNFGKSLDDDDAMCIGVGTAITFATGGLCNRNQHEQVLTIDKLMKERTIIMRQLCLKFKLVGDIKNALTNPDKRDEKIGTLDKQLVTCLGIPVIITIMQHFNIEQIKVSGTGLFYGAFFEEFFRF